jgi:Uncharacterized membrane protein (homolog of Drosophila rhomboid)
MTRCQACGKEEPAQAICNICGKTYCSDHLLRQNHNCFVDPKGINMGQSRVYVKTYGAGASKGTNPPKANYYDTDQFEQRHGYAEKRALPLWKSILTSPTYIIILICVLFQIITTLAFFSPTFYSIYNFLLLRADLGYITARPWTLITYMFLHSFNISHILFNMVTLYFFGPYLEKLIGKKSFIIMYLISGVVAAIGFILFEGNTGVGLVGASGAVCGVLGAVAILNPNLQVYVVIIPMKIKYMIVFYALASVLFMSTEGSLIAHAAHLVGIIIGLAFGLYYKKRIVDRIRQQHY